MYLIGTARDRINIADHLNRPQCSESPVPPRIFLGDRGRPRYLISRDQVEFLLERCFSVVDIASLLGVSVRTLERRLSEFGLRARSTYSDISDQALDNLMRNILTEFPNTGYKRMTGFLQARGLRIQQSRIREAMRRVNPVGVLLRALELRTIHRRRYQVYGLLALWHIDGNHKLIRYLLYSCASRSLGCAKMTGNIYKTGAKNEHRLGARTKKTLFLQTRYSNIKSSQFCVCTTIKVSGSIH